MRIIIISATLLAITYAAKNQQYAPPVAILKQIDKHNEDGSYSYGYEAADGTFKIETKYADGQVYGKYGYIDDTGALREVEYGASKRGFEPSGSEIQVAPPTLRNHQDPVRPLAPEEEDDGQYREDPSVYYQNEPGSQPQQRRPQQVQSIYSQPQYEPEPEPYRPPYRPQPAYRPEPKFRPQPTYQPEPAYRPEPKYQPEPAHRPAYRPPQASTRPKSYYVQEEPAYEPEYAPEEPRSYQPQPQPYRPQPQPYRPQPQPYRPQSNFGFSNNDNWNNPPQSSYNSNNYNQNSQSNGPSWAGHPASNVDIWTGSYSVNYK